MCKFHPSPKAKKLYPQIQLMQKGLILLIQLLVGQKSHQSSHGSIAFVLPLSKYPLLHPPLKGVEVITAKVDFFLATSDVAKFWQISHSLSATLNPWEAHPYPAKYFSKHRNPILNPSPPWLSNWGKILPWKPCRKESFVFFFIITMLVLPTRSH